MKATEEIRAWLNATAPDYVEGVNLLLSYGNKPATCAMLLQQHDRTRLYKLLNALYNSLTAESEPQAVSAAPVHTTPAAPVYTEREQGGYEVPAELSAQLREQLKEIDALKQQLYHIGRNSTTLKPKPLSKAEIRQRQVIAQRLTGKGGLNESSMLLMRQIAYYKQHGCMMPDKPQESVEKAIKPDADLYQLKENCRKQVPKLQKKIKDATAALKGAKGIEKTKLQNRIAGWTAQLTEAHAELNKLKAMIDARK